MSPQNKYYFISFIGGIGVGKTTAMKLVAKKLGFLPIREQFAKNDFLPLFYQNPKQWALASQLFYLSEKINQLLGIKEILKTTSVVLDVDINQDLCYLETQKALGNINRQEYAFYHHIYRKVEKVLPKPGLIVYLKSDAKVLKTRIGERGRAYESKISQYYLQVLIKTQEKWFKKNHRLVHLKIINTQGLNFADNTQDKEKFINLITKELFK
ncbi:MAG: deoxynucleoside kinase [Candidatus Nealsonbacteria bacterium]